MSQGGKNWLEKINGLNFFSHLTIEKNINKLYILYITLHYYFILLLHIVWNRLYISYFKINLQNVLSSYFFLIEELTFLALVCMRYLRQINVLVNLHAFLISYNFVKWFIVIFWSLWYSFELYLTISFHKIRFCVLRWPKLT